ncbi:hypothetical protein B0H17DRAFT_1169227 [Mycena rosella]|uniref:Uncharacterized protein n=1 Tax=Mycena rosella TaxID=1033263 RepID=A0AAD7DHZ0_MYCRO|nr:hypothetical protein B0H17DRAFT_1169227 [Mycena rosella]
MPTATSTVTAKTSTSTRKLKAAMSPPPPSAESSTAATLNTLYHRAARAFLLREVPLVHSLLESAFALLHPPEHLQNPDGLTPHRSKWDLLRITLETTIYASPPAGALPESLRELLAQPPHTLITSAYHRSLSLFTPRAEAQKASYVPSAVILTLVYSSLKLEAPDAGRVVVEDWLASRHYSHFSSVDAKEENVNYRKAVEAYCLYVLPKLEQWEYAREFLDYESELLPDARENFKSSLQALHAQTIAARLPLRIPPPSPSLLSPRPYSPTPSSSSSSSLSSTASVHTVVPATPRPRSNLAARPASARTASSSSASTTTATPRPTPSSLPVTSPPRSHHVAPRLYHPVRASAPPSTYALVKASLTPYLTSHAKLSAISLVTFVLLLVLPLLVRRRRAASKVGSEISGGNAELVRRRLLAASAASGSGAGLLGRVLTAVIQVVSDTVRMGGSGLV